MLRRPPMCTRSVPLFPYSTLFRSVRPIPQVAPGLPQARFAQAALLRSAFLGGDVLRTFAHTSDDYLPHSRRVSSAEILRYAPTLRPSGLRGGDRKSTRLNSSH